MNTMQAVMEDIKQTWGEQVKMLEGKNRILIDENASLERKLSETEKGLPEKIRNRLTTEIFRDAPTPHPKLLR